jgi:penicillin-binding protein 1A
VMRNAIIAAEDNFFYEHSGVDYIGIIRAFRNNIRNAEMGQGASTITQQLVKNLVLSRERSLRRKVQEAILAVELEQNLSKDEILTIYLNEIFFGVRYYGVEAASRYYFGHSASELTLSEAALLAGLPQSPNQYNPFRHPERALERRRYVLRQMFENRMIAEGEYREALEAPIGLVDPALRDPWLGVFPEYVDAVIDEAAAHVTDEQLYGGGLAIHTALRVDLQQLAQQAVRTGLQEFDQRHGFLRPADTVEPDAIAEWRASHHEDILQTGLQADASYRAVILQSDDESTRMGLGPLEVVLDRTPEARMRPDPEVPWSEALPVGAIFTVVPAGDIPPAALVGAESPPTVRFEPSAEAALVSIDVGTRGIVAMVSGFEHARGGFLRATQASRQTGSTFKAFVYAAALDAELISPATVYLDQPFTVQIPGQPNWSPANYDGEFLGPMSVREALARSRNVIAVRVLEQLTVPRAIAFAQRVGATSPLVDNLTLGLGSAEMPPLELTSMFATFAAGGVADTPWCIARIAGPEGDDLYRHVGAPTQVVRPEVNWLTVSLLRSVVTDGTGAAASRVGHPVAGKTGTTNGARDAWFVGFSTGLATGVWVGRDNNEELGRGETGGRSALPIWTAFMREALDGVTPEDFPPPPEGIETAWIDPVTGLRATPDFPGAREEFFLQGTAPTQMAPTPGERSADDLLLRGGGEGSGETGTTLDGF